MKNSEFSGPRYWKSLDDLAETPAFKDWVEREFPAGASELEGVNRRQFMKVMAASFGLAGLGMTGCRRPEQGDPDSASRLESGSGSGLEARRC